MFEHNAFLKQSVILMIRCALLKFTFCYNDCFQNLFFWVVCVCVCVCWGMGVAGFTQLWPLSSESKIRPNAVFALGLVLLWLDTGHT